MPHADLKSFSISIRHLLPMNEFESAILNGPAARACGCAVAVVARIAVSARITPATTRRNFVIELYPLPNGFRPRPWSAVALQVLSKTELPTRVKRSGHDV